MVLDRTRERTPAELLKAANASLSRQQLTGEIGRSGLAHYAGIVTQEFDSSLRGVRGAKLYDEMRRNDAIIGAMVNAIDFLLGGVGWKESLLDDSQEAQDQAQWLESARGDMSHSWADFLSEARTHLWFGWAYHEVTYKLRRGEAADPPSRFDDGKFGWRKITLLGQDTLDHWELDPQGGIHGMWQSAPPDFKAHLIPIEKAVLLRVRKERNNPESTSLFRNAVRPYLAKKGLEDIETIGADRDLTGIPIVWLPRNATSDDFAAARDIVERLRVDDQAGLVLQRFGAEPQDNWGFELVRSPGSKVVDVNRAIMRFSGEIGLVFLAQFLRLGMERVGSYSLAKEHKDLFHAALSAILDNMAETINRFLLPPLLRLNGEPVLVRLDHDPIAQSDLEAVSNFVTRLVQAQAIVPDERLEDALRGMADLPLRQREDVEKANGRLSQVVKAEGDEPLRRIGITGKEVEEVEREIERLALKVFRDQARAAGDLDALERELSR